MISEYNVAQKRHKCYEAIDLVLGWFVVTVTYKIKHWKSITWGIIEHRKLKKGTKVSKNHTFLLKKSVEL